MGRHLDALLARMAEEQASPRPTRRNRRVEAPEGLIKPPSRPISNLDRNPFDALRQQDRRAANIEFVPDEIVEIRYKFHATQRRFAKMFGISVKTLRNWEQGRRKPVGPARALLRVARANPEAVARVLWRYRRAWWMD